MIPRKKTHQTATQGRKVRNYGTGINYGAAVEGGPMPVIMGTNQVAPTLVYFNPGPGTVEPYLGKNYACLWGLCEGVIDSVPRYWRDTKRYIGTPQTAVILPCRDAWVHGTADPTLDWTVFGLPADANTLGCITAEETTATTAPDGTTNHLTKLWWNRGWVYIFGGHNTTVQGPTGNAKYIESPEFAWPATPTALNVWLKAANFDGQKVWVSLITTSGTVVETQIKTLTVANWTTASMGAALTASSEGALFKLQIGGMAGPPSYDWWTECVHAVSSPVYVWLEGAGTEWAIHKGEVGQDVDAAISANWGDDYSGTPPAPSQQTPAPGTDSLSFSGIANIATFDQYYNIDKPTIGNFLFEVKGPYTGAVTSPRYDGDGTDANAATALEILLVGEISRRGQILITGGRLFYGSAISSEIYDYSKNEWTMSGDMADARWQHTATLLLDGTVIVVGGSTEYGDIIGAEIYDPTTGVFTSTGSMNEARSIHTANLLADGRLLVAAGYESHIGFLDTAEVYDPSTRLFSYTGSLNVARGDHVSASLLDGTVLVAVGYGEISYTATAEIYDPATGVFTSTGSMNENRVGASATLLTDGTVLIVGGYGDAGVISGAEIYDPATGVFTPTSGNMAVARRHHKAIRLSNGKVLVTGGYGTTGVLSSCEIYYPSTGLFSATGSLTVATYDHTISLLSDGNVIVVGGHTGLAQAELYNSASGTWSTLASMSTDREWAAAVVLP